MKLLTDTAPWNDGLVHGIAATVREHGTRCVTTRCGLTLDQAVEFPLWGASGFDSRVTCPDCTPTPRRTP